MSMSEGEGISLGESDQIIHEESEEDMTVLSDGKIGLKDVKAGEAENAAAVVGNTVAGESTLTAPEEDILPQEVTCLLPWREWDKTGMKLLYFDFRFQITASKILLDLKPFDFNWFE